MQKYILNKQIFLIFLLIFLAGFLIWPNFGLAQRIEDINIKEIEKYLEIPEDKVESLIHSLINLFNSKWIDLMASGFSTEEERAVPNIMREVVRTQALNHLLVDAPIGTTWRILKAGIKIVKIYIDPTVALEEIEKLTVEKAVEEGKRQLFQNEVRITPGAIDFKYISREGEEKIAHFQYVMIYKPSSPPKGEILIRFYSSQPLEPPISRGSPWGSVGIYTELTDNLPPFIVDIQGEVENYQWVGEPSMKINFSGPVPDLGIKPLSFWERHLLKPIKTTIKEVEVIITKVTGKAPKIVERATGIWKKVKSTISKYIPVSPAALVPTPKIPEAEEAHPLTVKETKEGIIQEVGKPEGETKEKGGAEEEEVEIKPPPFPTGSKERKSREERRAEILEMLDDLTEEIDVLSQRVARLAAEKGVKLVGEEKEEIKEEPEKLEELAKEKKRRKKEEICQPNSININTASKEELEKITGIGPMIAQRIIEARPFSSLNDLLRVKGIGKKTLQKIIAQGCAYIEGFYFAGSSFSPPPPPPSLKILISEIQISPITERFIELYNPNDQNVDLTGWYIQRKTGTTWTSLISSSQFERKFIGAKSHFLITRSREGDIVLSRLTLTENNSLRLRNPNRNTVDLVGWGEAQDFETTAAENPPAGKSLGRKWNQENQTYQDTDNNSQDFEIQIPTPGFQNQLPIARFIYTPPNPKVGQEIIFDASSSTDPDGTVTNYIWDFGDGNSTTTNSTTTTHSYSTSSDFIVTLLVVDNLGATSSPATTTLTIFGPPALKISTTSLNFFGRENGENPESQNLIIENIGGGNLNWNATQTDNWFSVTPTSGVISQHSSSTLKISVDIFELASGNYNATLTISTLENGSSSISVNLTILPFWQGAEGENKIASLILVGNYLYAGLETAPAKVIKIDLSSGTTLAIWTAPSSNFQSVLSLTFDGKYLYAGTGNYPARIIKIDPNTMETVGPIWEGDPSRDGAVNALVSAGDYIYGCLVQNSYSGLAKVIKIDSLTMSSTSTWQAPAPGISKVCRDLILAGDSLYAAGPGRGGVYKINPMNMTTQGYWEKGAAFSLTFENDLLYATLGQEGIVKIDPSNMTTNTTSTLDGVSSWWHLTQGGGYLYASASICPFKVEVAKINPNNLSIEKIWQGSTGEIVQDLLVADNYLYLGLATSPAKIIKKVINE